MFILYILKHSETKELYIGRTNNPKRRLKEHNAGLQKSTKRSTGIWNIVYAEAYRNKKDAVQRELKLKQHGSNKRWLLDRIKYSIED